MGSLPDATETPSLGPPEALGARSWKSGFSQRVASKKISEEFEYFAKIYEQLNLEGLRGAEAVLYALEHASNASKASELRDADKQVTELPLGSKVCIIGAGMSGQYRWVVKTILKY